MDPREIYVNQSAVSDPEALAEAFIGCLDFLRDRAGFRAEEIAPEALEIEAAWEYLSGVYNDFHALHFHNLLRNNRFDEAMPKIGRGLQRLGVSDYVENLNQAVRLYEANTSLWDVPRFGGASDEYRRAKAVMKPADDRFCALDRANDRRELVAGAILKLRMLRIVDGADLAGIRDRILDSSRAHARQQEEATAGEVRRAEEEARASQIRSQQSLRNPVAFAAETLSKRAGYTDVLMSPGEAELSDDGAVEMWRVTLQTKDRQAQHNCLVRSNGRFGLFDYQMETLRCSAAESELESERTKLLRRSSQPPSPASGLRRLFGRRDS